MEGLSFISLYSVPTTATIPSSGTDRMRTTAAGEQVTGRGGGRRVQGSQAERHEAAEMKAAEPSGTFCNSACATQPDGGSQASPVSTVKRTWHVRPRAPRRRLHRATHLLQAVEVQLGVLPVIVLVLQQEAVVAALVGGRGAH